MMRLLRPRRFATGPTRKFTKDTNLFGTPLKGEARLAALNRVAGFEKMLLNKLSFFYVTGNVFTIY